LKKPNFWFLLEAPSKEEPEDIEYVETDEEKKEEKDSEEGVEKKKVDNKKEGEEDEEETEEDEEDDGFDMEDEEETDNELVDNEPGDDEDSLADNPSDKPELEEVKKLRLLKNYDQLIDISYNLKNTMAYIDNSGLTPKERDIFNALCDNLTDATGKLHFTIRNCFQGMSYANLLSIYLYSKITIQQVAKFVDLLIQK
jgi:hypothetical protein